MVDLERTELASSNRDAFSGTLTGTDLQTQSLRCPPTKVGVCWHRHWEFGSPCGWGEPSSESDSDLVNKGEAGAQSDGAATPPLTAFNSKILVREWSGRENIPPKGASGCQRQVAQNEYWGPPLSNLRSGLPSVWLRSRRMCQGSPRLVEGVGIPGRKRSAVL